MIFMKRMSFIFSLFFAANIFAAISPKAYKKNTYDILMEKKGLEDTIVGWGLSPNGRYFVYSELEEIYYLDVNSKMIHRIGYFDISNGKIGLKFSENSSTFVMKNDKRIMVYNLEVQEIQLDKTLEGVSDSYLSEDGKNLVYVAESSVKFGTSASTKIYFYDLINKKLKRTADTSRGYSRRIIPCQFGTCIAFRDYRYRFGAILDDGGHAQVISMDGRTAWENPFLEMDYSELQADNRGQIYVHAYKKDNYFSNCEDSKGNCVDYYMVVDLMTQRELYHSTKSSSWVGNRFFEIWSIGDERFLGITLKDIKLLGSHGEVIDEAPLRTILNIKRSKNLQYVMEYKGYGASEEVSVTKVDKANEKLKSYVKVTSTSPVLSYEFTSDSNFLFTRFFNGDVILTDLENGQQSKLPTQSMVINSKVLNQRPIALVLEKNGTLGAIRFNKNQFQYQALYNVPFKIDDKEWLRSETEIFSSHDEKIHALWNNNGFSIMKINDPTE